MPLQVLSVAPEIFPLVKTGGLGDVTGALPAALARQGVAVRSLVPAYPAVTDAVKDVTPVLSIGALFGGPARLLSAKAAGLDLLVLDAPHLYNRPGNPYVGPDGRDWPDNAQRFAGLCRVAADIGSGAMPGYRPNVVHAHDWQGGLTSAYLHYRGSPRPGSVMTIHNLAYPGKVPVQLLAPLGLPSGAYAVDGVEFYGTISLLKAGLQFADRITTVSPTYAMEIRTAEFGMGFDGLLRHRSAIVSGILNGIDTDVWNPTDDKLIAACFDRDTLDRRARNKAALQARMDLPLDPAAPLFGVVSRLTWQKGLDMLLDCLPTVRAIGGQLAILGTGDASIEAALRVHAHEPHIGLRLGYDEALAHLVQAGADALLVPSRFEPCGLTQLCALRYGAVPVVARVGGLADTVIDANPAALAAGVATGVQFAPVTAEAFDLALRRTADLYHSIDNWRRLQRNGMAADVSWDEPARRYAALYRDLVSARS